MLGIKNKVLHMDFEAKHESQLEKMKLGFKVPNGFTPLSNAWLWVPQGPYSKFANVRWVSNLMSNSAIFDTLFKFLSHLKIYYSGKQHNNPYL
jgi:hypothetical protein